jgi:hypothetical protein
MIMTQPTITLAGTVQKLIDRSMPKQPQMAQLSFPGADHLYDELRIPDTLGWEEGKTVEVTFRLLSPELPQGA